MKALHKAEIRSELDGEVRTTIIKIDGMEIRNIKEVEVELPSFKGEPIPVITLRFYVDLK